MGSVPIFHGDVDAPGTWQSKIISTVETLYLALYHRCRYTLVPNTIVLSLIRQVFLVTGFLIEWALSKKGLSESVGMILHHINSHGSFVVCIFIVWNFIEKPAIGGCLLLFGTVTWMKLVSYALTNQDYRLSSNNKDEAPHHSTLAIIHNLDSDDWNIEYPRYRYCRLHFAKSTCFIF